MGEPQTWWKPSAQCGQQSPENHRPKQIGFLSLDSALRIHVGCSIQGQDQRTESIGHGASGLLVRIFSLVHLVVSSASIQYFGSRGPNTILIECFWTTSH